MIKINDAFEALVGWGPHVGVRFRVVGEPGERLFERPSEAVTEVASLHAGRVLDDAEQVGPCRSQRAPGVELTDTVELPQQGLATGLQIALQNLLLRAHVWAGFG